MATISKQELVRLQKKYQTDARIGEEFGITRQAVHQLRKKYEIESVRRDMDERNENIVAMQNNGKKITEIAKKYDLSIPTIYRIIHKVESKASKKKSKKSK